MNSDDSWTTVRSGPRAPANNSAWGSRSAQPRQMPSAFSGGGFNQSDERTMQRREYDRMNAEADAAVKARDARVAREKRDAAAAKDRDALALDSETSYPSLGGNSTAAAAPSSKFATNFRDKVAAMAAREKEAEELRALADAAAAASAEYDWAPTGLSTAAAAHRRRTLIGTRCFDDGVEDYNGPEEFDDIDDVSVISDHEDDNDAPADEEHNAHLGDIRRRNKNSLY